MAGHSRALNRLSSAIWRRRPKDWRAVLPYLAMSYLYKRSNRIWHFLIRYRLTAFDNRGAGRTPMPEGLATVEAMADDAAGVLRALDVPNAHVAGFSMGSAIAQGLALRHP